MCAIFTQWKIVKEMKREGGLRVDTETFKLPEARPIREKFHK